ncbi:MAG: glycolate oxidase subunit GlcE [Rhodocyclaceae bacterium]|nr:glycolate oxidase subunit GlcE [Rhodocyclaceae bacterium]
MNDISAQLADRVRAATGPLCIRGGGSKEFFGNAPRGEVLDTREHTGIVAYEPTELFVTAKCGTPLTEIEAALAAQGQCLAFEPPRFGAESTIGGVVAAGLSGPRRASAGSLRDFVLGVKLLDGAARELNFGGQVIKNVAGYDVSRLIAGSLGTLGLILEVSLKVLPKPVAESTLRFAMSEDEALDRLNRWAGQPLPIVASTWQDGMLTLKLAGARAAVEAAVEKLGAGGTAPDGFWDALRDQTAPFFVGESPLWRLSVPSVAPQLDLPGATLIEWGGAQRWLRSNAVPETIRTAAASVGGSATLYRADAALKAAVGTFAPLPEPLMKLHRNLKAAFDPRGIFNPGRLYPEL